MSELITLISEIKEELYHYEFHMFESFEKDSITVDDYLKSIVSCVTGSKQKHYLRRIDKIAKDIGDEERITFDQYLAF
jgi:hypothetical protein